MKKIKILLLLLLPAISAISQDTLVLKDGTESLVKVIEIDGDIIKYKKHLLPDGPLYNIKGEKVFMIFYKGGARELVKSSTSFSSVSGDNNKIEEKSNTAVVDILRDEEKGWELRLSEQKLAPNKNKNWLEYNAVVSVYKNGKYITHLGVVCNQHLKKKKAGEKIDKGFVNKSFIVFAVGADRPLANLLYEKYENISGKGLGWGVDWDFLKQGYGSCTIKHFFTDTQIGDVKLNRDYIEYKLKDCSTIERRVLSAGIIWLNTNFGSSSDKSK